MSGDNCGTYAGSQRHRRRKEKCCAPCLTAANEYAREWRTKSNRWRDQNKARAKAMVALAAIHPDEYQRLYNRERNAQRSGAA